MHFKLPFNLSFFTLIIILFACQKTKNINSDYTFQGSNTSKDVTQHLAKMYNRSNTKKITVKGGGSEKAILAFTNGEIRLLNSSRRLSESELLKASDEHGSEIYEIIIALDAIAIIVNPKLGVHELSLEDIYGIYSGKITNWKDLGGPNIIIRPLSRDENSGTMHFFKDKFIGQHEEFSTNVIKKKNAKEIIRQVKKNSSYIGFVDLASVSDKHHFPKSGIWAINIKIEGQESISPFERLKILDGSYPLTRPIYQYITKNSESFIKDFVSFELSSIGQQIMEQKGFFPIQAIHEQFNTQNGFFATK